MRKYVARLVVGFLLTVVLASPTTQLWVKGSHPTRPGMVLVHSEA